LIIFKRNIICFCLFLAPWGSEISSLIVGAHVCIFEMDLTVVIFDVLAVICCIVLPSGKELRI